MDEASDSSRREKQREVSSEIRNQKVGEEKINRKQNPVQRVFCDESLAAMRIKNQKIHERNVADGGEVAGFSIHGMKISAMRDVGVG